MRVGEGSIGILRTTVTGGTYELGRGLESRVPEYRTPTSDTLAQIPRTTLPERCRIGRSITMTGEQPDLFAGDVGAVIFDLDGVITDTASVHSAAWKRLFDEYLEGRAERTGSAPATPAGTRATSMARTARIASRLSRRLRAVLGT